jgi:hypothetical protein
VDRLDHAIALIVEQGLAPKAIHLTDDDYELLKAHETRYWRKLRSAGLATCGRAPTSDVPLISEKLVEVVELPVRRAHPEPRRSAVYANTGQRVPLDIE